MTPRRTKAQRAVDGVLLLDKPSGASSNRALQVARRLYGAAKAGHAGTLDPAATGLLVVLFGEATKFAGALLGADKSYEAVVRLGVVTATGDAEGEVVSARDPDVSPERAARTVASFVGEIDQVPPMHSALKKDGKPYYAYARSGQEIERRARRVVVYELEVRAFDGIELVLAARVSTGTYVRTLAQDIGERLGCGAHLAALRRTRVGTFDLADAFTLEQLESMNPDGLPRALRPVDTLLAGLPQVDLAAAATLRFTQGQPVTLDPDETRGAVRVYGPGPTFLGKGRAVDGWLHPERLMAVAAAREPDSPC